MNEIWEGKGQGARYGVCELLRLIEVGASKDKYCLI